MSPSEISQTQTNREQALERFDTALGELETHLASVFGKDGARADGAVLKEQIRALIEERDQLLAELETERARVQNLKAANEEVSGRLTAVLGTLKGMVPA